MVCSWCEECDFFCRLSTATISDYFDTYSGARHKRPVFDHVGPLPNSPGVIPSFDTEYTLSAGGLADSS